MTKTIMLKDILLSLVFGLVIVGILSLLVFFFWCFASFVAWTPLEITSNTWVIFRLCGGIAFIGGICGYYQKFDNN